MRISIILALSLAVLAGCGESQVQEAPKPPPVPTRTQSVVKGVVKLNGVAPTPKPLDNSICKHAGSIVDESVIVGPDNGLKNAIVYAPNIAGPADETPPAALLDQKNCQFIPHVLAVRVGQTLTIRNSEDELHNAHANPKANPAFNIALNSNGAQQDMSFKKPEFIRVKCDVHPWMSNYIGVIDSGFFAVTDDAGRFEIKGLPVGTHQIKVWHERYGELTQTVTITDSATETSFTYGM